MVDEPATPEPAIFAPIARQIVRMFDRLRWVDARTLGLLLLVVAVRGALGVASDIDFLTQAFRGTTLPYGGVLSVPNYIKVNNAAALAQGVADLAVAAGAAGMLLRGRGRTLAAGGLFGAALCSLVQLIVAVENHGSGNGIRADALTLAYLAVLGAITAAATPGAVAGFATEPQPEI